MTTDPRLESLVTNRPLNIDSLVEVPTCPCCGATELDGKGRASTMLGYVSGRDPNHHWDSYVCRSCHEMFARESQADSVWYTQRQGEARAHKLLRGVPTCSGQYAYTCAHCGGDVFERHFTPDGRLRDQGFYSSDDIDGYVCTSCPASVLLTRDPK